MKSFSAAFPMLDVKSRFVAHVVGYMLLVLPILYLPGFSSYAIIRYAVFGIVALLLGLFTLYTLLTSSSARALFKKAVPMYALLAYVLAYALTSFTSIDPAASFFSTFVRADGWFTLLFVSLFAIGASLVLMRGGESVMYSWLTSSVIGATLFSVLILVSSSGLNLVHWQALEGGRGGATIGNSSLAALYVVWNIFFVLILLKRAAGKQKRNLIAALVVMLGSSLFVHWYVLLGRRPAEGVMSFLGDARAGIVALMVGSLVAGSCWLARDVSRRRRSIGLVALTAVVISSCFFGFQLVSRSSTLQSQFIEAAGRNRVLFWESALRGFQERPLVGYGPNTFSDLYYQDFNPTVFQEGETVEALADKPHNMFFEALAGGGIILTFTLIVYLGAILMMLVSLSKSNRLLGSVLTGAFAAWIIQMQFVFDSLSSLALLSLVFAIGFSRGGEQKSEAVSTPSRSWHKLVLGGYILLAFVVVMYAIIWPLQKAWVMNRVYRMDLPARAAAWSSLSGISPMGDQYDSELMFNDIFNVYSRNTNQLRADTTPLKDAVLAELDAIGVHLNSIITQEENRFELVLLTAQFKYLRIYIANRFTLEDVKQLESLAQRAFDQSPHNTRAKGLYDGVIKFKAANPVK